MPRSKKTKSEVSPENIQRSKRARKTVNYAEKNYGNKNDRDSGSDFEPDKSESPKENKNTRGESFTTDDDIPLKHVARKQIKKLKPASNETSLLNNGYGIRPNLSEDESSESEDEAPVKALCLETTSDINKDVKASSEDNIETAESRNSIELENEIETKITESKNPVEFENVDYEKMELKHDELTHDISKGHGILETARPMKSEPEISSPSLARKLRKRKSDSQLESKVFKKKKVQVVVEDIADEQKNTEIKKRRSTKKQVKQASSSKHSAKEDSGHSNIMDTLLKTKSNTGFSSDDESDDWEDVDEIKLKSPKKNAENTEKEDLNIKGVEISVGVSSIHQKKKRKSRQEKMFIWLRQMAGRVLKERKILLHKCHILCMFSHSLWKNEICNSPLNQGVCFSLIPKDYANMHDGRIKTWGLPQIVRLVKWFQQEVPAANELALYIDKEAEEFKLLGRIHILIMILRALGFLTRLISSLQPCSPKLKESDSNPSSPTETTPSEPGSSKKTEKTSKQAKSNTKKSTPKAAEKTVKSPYFDSKKTDATQKRSKTSATKSIQNENKKQQKESRKSAEREEVSSSKPKRRSLKKVDYNEDRAYTDSDFKKLGSRRSQKARVPDGKESELEDDDDDDFEETKTKSTPKAPRKSIDSKRTSNEEKTEGKSKSPKEKPKPKPLPKKSIVPGIDHWIEVYLPSLQEWICIEITTEDVNRPEKMENLATRPLQYVIGIDNHQKVKDVTCRYAEKWLSHNRKLRIDREWWSQTVEPYNPLQSAMDTAEDAKLKRDLLQKDFPTSISEFKNHPLYALERHLLKFEAIYPPDAAPLGFMRKEAIYMRECVHELHTRETWLKQARCIKFGEEAYKLVKGRPKRHTPEHERDNLKLEVFGLWQTEVYVPPPVKDGIVPKNEYGNVELFKPSMLPEGAVHLPMNNMMKIARKLKIDHAQAMMGWDFHGGWSHPVFEGIVVAKEHEDVLLDAWRVEEEETRRKEKEKREKVIYEHWKTLIKGILIRHKLKAKYNFEEDEQTAEKKVNSKKPKVVTKPKVKATTKATTKAKKSTTKKKSDVKDEYTDLSVSWPLNRQDGKSSIVDEGHVHVFPESAHITNPANGATTKVCSCGLKMPLDDVMEQL